MRIDCDIDLQEHLMVRPAYRLGCRLQIHSFPLSAEAIALFRAEAKFPVAGGDPGFLWRSPGRR